MNIEKYSLEKNSFIPKVWRTLKQKGFRYLIDAVIRRIRFHLILPLVYCYYKYFKLRNTFFFQHKKYRYFYHRYNRTWRNERTVEIPIIWSIVKPFHGCILEVGNVLSHYFPINHDVVDKYENAKGILNEDVAEFVSDKKYDLIVSISTLEHVGWDEKPLDRNPISDPEKILHVINRLKSLLSPEGKIIFTVPLGYNPNLDALLKNRNLEFSKTFLMKRISKNKWIEAEWIEVENIEYDKKIPSANALLVGIIEA